jgi:hypothetical protein
MSKGPVDDGCVAHALIRRTAVEALHRESRRSNLTPVQRSDGSCVEWSTGSPSGRALVCSVRHRSRITVTSSPRRVVPTEAKWGIRCRFWLVVIVPSARDGIRAPLAGAAPRRR